MSIVLLESPDCLGFQLPASQAQPVIADTLGIGNPGDNSAILRFKKRMAAELRQQLTIGAPTNQDEAGLRRLSSQLKAGKLVIKPFLRHPLHAKLYLVHRKSFKEHVAARRRVATFAPIRWSGSRAIAI